MAPRFDGSDSKQNYKNNLDRLFLAFGLTGDQCLEHKMPQPGCVGRPKRKCEFCLKGIFEETLQVMNGFRNAEKLREAQKSLEHYNLHKAGVYIVERDCSCHFCTRLKYMPDDLGEFAIEIALRLKEASLEEGDDYDCERHDSESNRDDFNETTEFPIGGYRTCLTRPLLVEPPASQPIPTTMQKIRNWFVGLFSQTERVEGRSFPTT